MPLPLVGAVAGGAARLGARSLIGRTAARGMMMGMGGGGGSGINVPVTTVAEIKLTSNVEGINARMSNLVMKQIRFATAQALTQTAKNLVAQNGALALSLKAQLSGPHKHSGLNLLR